jgi:hypothetical protein
MATAQSSPLLKVGDRVKILHSGNKRGRIVELRGPLGPGGAQVYGVRLRVGSKPTYVEFWEDQLAPLTSKAKSTPSS